jgi:hypothetical protein
MFTITSFKKSKYRSLIYKIDSRVKAGTFNAGNRKEDTTDRGKLYKPTTKHDILAKEAPMRPVEKVALGEGGCRIGTG